MSNKTKHPKAFSRRAFARGAAMVAAAVTMPADLLAQAQPPASKSAAEAEKPSQQTPKLSAAGQADAETKIQNILQKYGSRLNDPEKTDVRRLVLSLEESLEKMRAFPLENWDEPALVLRPVIENEEAKLHD